MCGIAGIFSSGRIDPELLRAMAGAIRHRGPDDEGFWIDGDAGIGFAHRRLSIVDPSPQGHQPMHSADGRHVISFNGEVYNHAALRDELKARLLSPEGGWRGHSDTETLLQAIACWGLDAAIGKAVGMFAFALWDRKERKLHLVRDRFGEKPFYYGWAGKDFVFASEVKAIRLHPEFEGVIDRRALKQLASRGYIPAPHSIYRGIYKLPPASVLTLSADGVAQPFSKPPEEGTAGALQLRRYWSYREVVQGGLREPVADEGQALEEIENALAQAIKDQSVADVPIGAFLSGGIDSSTVVALYQKYAAQPVRTYSIGFEEAGFDEARHAKAVAAHLGTIHHEHYVTAREARDVIPLLPAIYDEPFADSSQIPTYLVSRFARQEVTVALTGDGGDELFGGYNRHRLAPRLWRHLQRLPKSIRSIATTSLGQLPEGFWERAAAISGGRGPHLAGKIRKSLQIAGSAESLDDIYRGLLDEWSLDPSPVLNADGERWDNIPFSGDGAADAVRIMYADAVSYLPDDILTKVDRASMAVSLETRVPFLDHRVAEVAARVPVELKLRNGRGKFPLRQLLGRQMPSALFERPKAGFAIPVGEWIKGELRPWAEDLLDPARMAGEGWFDASIVQRRWRDHIDGRRDSTAALWAILMFQAWSREQRETAALAA